MGRIFQVTLNDNSDVSGVDKFLLGQDGFKNLQRQVFFLVRLHIHIDKCTMFPRNSQQFSKTPPHSFQDTFRIDGIEVWIERGQFHR